MVPLLLVGAAAFAAGVFISKFWKQIVKFFQTIYQKLPASVRNKIERYFILIQKIGNGLYKQVVKLYEPLYDTSIGKFFRGLFGRPQYRETVSERIIDDPSEIPAHIRQRVDDYYMADITDEVEEKLELKH
ncbi:hypothetical protein DC083_08880 [Ignatzschineria ureiclastica]|uniref:Uncharacterized protein n=1 Tax=Ignatzschineria ureiclastica TaxID=472582 RepID=A0A2U2ACP0_9GAMM|nr:hypothetical protein [Ignatzschineria ureiclastica]PWD80421.1 hypothetical protein DC083_08880 [Ignatzschineria ureiclastica]GGZ99637.1 hypothetical protein GCM10007162_14780 [Ignatzschineria ureiclastica]